MTRPATVLPTTMPVPSGVLVTAGSPETLMAGERNTASSGFFCDIGNLTAAERAWLLRETNREGSILVVLLFGAKGDLGVRQLAIMRPGRRTQRLAGPLRDVGIG